jgi:benzoyl-CoA reductase subunit C
MNALEQIEIYFNDRSRRAREWHEAGGKVIGYFCCFVPEEIIAALDMLPFRIQCRPGEPIDQADAYIEPMACPFARSCFNLALKGEYDFLDGFVAPHSCDTVERLFPIWRHNKPSSFNHLLNVPHMQG